MKLHQNCIECIFNQAKRVSSLLNLSKKEEIEVLNIAKKHINSFDFNLTPPHNATPLYRDISRFLKTDDLYKDIKEQSTTKAFKFAKICQDRVDNTHDKFLYALKTAVAGNVIDFAAEIIYDLEEEIEKIYSTNFKIDDSRELKEKLQSTKKLVYLGDNTAEEIFDKICIKTLKSIYPQLDVYYFVRGEPIINDLTMNEAKRSGLDEVATLVDSGVPTPGYAIDLAKKEAHNIFRSADCIISKGMGNYECLSEYGEFPIFFLLKVKCQVVANDIGASLGDVICKGSLSWK